jgi:hypothetical protein
MFIHITKEELTKEILKKAWYQTNNIIFTTILVYPLFSIVDFICHKYVAAVFHSPYNNCNHYLRAAYLLQQTQTKFPNTAAHIFFYALGNVGAALQPGEH